jgi:hypothetical protein
MQHVSHYVVTQKKSCFRLRDPFLLHLVGLASTKRRELDEENAGKIRLYTTMVELEYI